MTKLISTQAGRKDKCPFLSSGTTLFAMTIYARVMQPVLPLTLVHKERKMQPMKRPKRAKEEEKVTRKKKRSISKNTCLVSKIRRRRKQKRKKTKQRHEATNK